jgi:arylsulfatase A-like enzyme
VWCADGGGSSSKCTLFEAGHREVGIFRWLGTIQPGVTSVIASSMDYMPTIAGLAGLKLPTHSATTGLVLRFDGMCAHQMSIAYS